MVQETLARLPWIGKVAGDAHIRSLFRAAELPQEVLNEVAKRGIPGSEIHGVLHHGYTYLVREKIKMQADLEAARLTLNQDEDDHGR